MKTLCSILFLIFSYTHLCAQALIIDSTRFVSGITVATAINYAIPTADKGILFVGADADNPGGIIPYFPIDTVLENVFIGKIDSNHQISWLKVYGGSRDDEGMSACQTPDGGYAVLATTLSNDGDVTGLMGAEDMWLVRTDNVGNLLWQKNFGCTAGGTLAMSVANTPDGGFILLGASNGYGGDVPFHYGGEFDQDWVVVKTDSAGNLEWCKDLGGTQNETNNGSILYANGNYYLVGSSNSTDHDCTDTAWHPGVSTGYDFYILELNDTGAVLWDSSYGGSGDEDAMYAMYDTRDSTIMITGSTASNNNYMVTGFNGGYSDMWVIKVNLDGRLIWQKALGGPQEEIGTGVCTAPGGGYIAYGSTYIGPIGGEDCWLFALDNSGNEMTNKIFGGNSDESPNSVVSYLGSYVCTGNSASSVFTEGSCNVNYSGAFVSYLDYWPLSVVNVTKNEEQLFVYPNPTNGNVRIVIPDAESGNITIINSIGQVINTEKINQGTNNIEINTETWAKGLYLVQWHSEGGSVLSAKLVNN